MAHLPWLMLVLLAAVYGKRHHHYHLDTINLAEQGCRDEYTVTLNGSKVGVADKYKWKQTTPYLQRVRFDRTDAVAVNVTLARLPSDDQYKFKLTARNRNPSSRKVQIQATADVAVRYRDVSSEGTRKFATDVVYTLLKMNYDYIALAYQHQKVTCFHPRVYAYFRNMAKARTSMLDEVVQYIHEKQASEDAASECPSDYVTMMDEDGFRSDITIEAIESDVMVTTFRKAYEYETELGNLLALVFHHAEKNKEIELAEFVAADLLPRVTKAINSHKNFIETALFGTEGAPDRHLKEFLLDKRMSM